MFPNRNELFIWIGSQLVPQDFQEIHARLETNACDSTNEFAKILVKTTTMLHMSVFVLFLHHQYCHVTRQNLQFQRHKYEFPQKSAYLTLFLHTFTIPPYFPFCGTL